MAKSNGELTNKLAGQGAKITPVAFDQQLGGWVLANRKGLEKLIDSEEVDRVVNLVRATASRNVGLLECTIESLGQGILACAQMKLYPGAMQEVALVPFRNGKTGNKEAVFMPMYQGLVKLAYNAGVVKSINSEVVYEKDEFSFELGTNQHLKHVPYLDGDRGKRVAVYCVIKTNYGGDQITVLSPKFVQSIKNRSKASKSSDSPWNNGHDTDVDAMWKKTALKQAFKSIPKSPDLQTAIEKDDKIEMPDTEKPEIIDMGKAESIVVQDVELKTGDELAKEQAPLPNI